MSETIVVVPEERKKFARGQSTLTQDGQVPSFELALRAPLITRAGCDRILRLFARPRRQDKVLPEPSGNGRGTTLLIAGEFHALSKLDVCSCTRNRTAGDIGDRPGGRLRQVSCLHGSMGSQ